MRMITEVHPNRQRHRERTTFERNHPLKVISKGLCGVSITIRQAWVPSSRAHQLWGGGEISSPIQMKARLGNCSNLLQLQNAGRSLV